MDEQNPSRHPLVAGLGTLLICSTLAPGWAPLGPWGSESFTRGLFGLVGGFMIYASWYRHTFGEWGIIPALHMWSNSESSIRILCGLGVGLFFTSYLVVTVESLPAPFSLILLFCSLLLLLASAYAWLSLEGPLSDEEE